MPRRRWSGCSRSKREIDVDYVPHVVAWNLTRRCNLECAHCYIAAGPHESAATELDTAACREIVDQLLLVNPAPRSGEHTSELQSQSNIVCRLLLEKKKKNDSISI